MGVEKCAPDDPRRCAGVVTAGQCQNLAAEGSEFCERHIPWGAKKKYRKQKVQRYMIEQQELKVAYDRQFRDADYLDMKEEILLIHSLIDRTTNALKIQQGDFSGVSILNSLFQRLESMKTSLLKIQREMNLVIGKDALRELAKNIAIILDEELEGVNGKGELLEKISDRICEEIETIGSEGKQED